MKLRSANKTNGPVVTEEAVEPVVAVCASVLPAARSRGGKKHGGVQPTMRAFSAAEKQLLHELLDVYHAHPRKWIMISEQLSHDPSMRRTPDSLRNHILRWQKGKERTAAGLSKKHCSICGMKKAGHLCQGIPRGKALSEAQDDLQAVVDLSPLDSALAGGPFVATRLAPWSPPHSTQGDDDWLAGPPGLVLRESDFMPDFDDPGFSLPILALPPVPLLHTQLA